MLQTREKAESTGQDSQTPPLQQPNPSFLGGGVAEMIIPGAQMFHEAMEVDEVYADPTTDIGFKILLNQDKEVLISIINNLLDFEGDNKIVELEISSNENPADFISSQKGQSGIVTSVDILCTNKGQHKIAIEMQRQKEKYFLAREQFYMAKLIANQVKVGESKLYHEAVLETYIIVIGRSNMFTRETAIKEEKLFEIDVKPMIVQTGEVYPGNKMNWRFFELPKFELSDKYKNMTKESPIKYQWLGFLIDCSHEAVKLDREEIIQKGYEIMKISTWSEDQRILYWKEKDNERAAQQILKESTEEAFEQGLKEGIEKGIERGKLKGEIKGEIVRVKDFIESEIPREKFIHKLKFLTNPKISHELDSNLHYIANNMDGYESDICDTLDLVGKIMG